MAPVAFQLIEEVTAHAQSDSLEDALEICAEGTYFPNNLPTSYRLNMFRALLCPSSGARDCNVHYHIGRFVLGFAVGLGRALACSPDTTPAYPHLTSNLQQTKNETTNVVNKIIVASS